VVSSTYVLDATLADLSANLSPHKGYHGAAIGKGRQLAKTELEKLKLSELSTREAVFEAARM
jgi:20S proteasome alpha/beta subunit